MKIQTIKSAMIDKYNNQYIYKTTTKIHNKNTNSNVVVTCNDFPIYKVTNNNGKVKEYDMGLFGKWVERKPNELLRG